MRKVGRMEAQNQQGRMEAQNQQRRTRKEQVGPVQSETGVEVAVQRTILQLLQL